MPKTLSESILQSKPITAATSVLKTFKGSLLRSRLITVALGLTLALTAWTLIQAVVGDLIAPLIAVFIGESHFELNSFTIGESEFRYGPLIEAAIAFGFAGALVYFLYVVPNRQGGNSDRAAAKTRPCPECTTPIPVAAKRCPHCTTVIQPNAA